LRGYKFQRTAAAWRRDTGKAVTIVYATSPALARQIEGGAPADIFVSADLEWMDYLEARKLIRPDTRFDLISNSLVLIASSDSPLAFDVTALHDLSGPLGDGRLAIGEVTATPIGRYAKRALEQLGLWQGVADRLVQTENVRVALTLVARGEATLGIVYASDAKVEPKVKVVATFPASSHQPIVYPAALTADARHQDAAALLQFLRSPAASSAFIELGFSSLSKQ
jgi:molybdate transport system substrate-binding protein